MDTWIDWASGPLFRISLAICLLGLVYRLGSSLGQIRSSWVRTPVPERAEEVTMPYLLPWVA